MASRPKADTDHQAPRTGGATRPSPIQDHERAGGTREAIREIVRRYRETFERLGR
jgi:hypothetical protein